MADQTTRRQMTRKEVPIEQTWNLADIYPSFAAWEADLQAVEEALPSLVAYQGRLGEGAQTLLTFLKERDATAERFGRIASYAELSLAVDGASSEAQAMQGRVMELRARIAAALAFVFYELLSLPEGTVNAFLEAEPELATYQKQLGEVLLRRRHTLSAETERALGALAGALSLPGTIWDRVTSADLACSPVDDGTGELVPVSIGRWLFGYSQSPNRELRRRAYESLTEGLGRHKHTLATTLAAEVTRNVTQARLRGHRSAVEMLLAPERVPEDVYRMILAEVHDGMAPHVRRLVHLRQRVLGLEEMQYYDLDAPLGPTAGASSMLALSYEQGRELILEGLRVLGDEYRGILEAAFQSRWIDWADNVSRRWVPFCESVYGVHPYVFVAWQGQFQNALFLAHELGHAGNFVLSSRRQIVSNTDGMRPVFTGTPFSRFFVEAPSNANMILVGQHLLDTTDDPQLRRAVAEQILSGTFMSFMVTAPLLAHFQQSLYDVAEAGRPLTTSTILDAQAEVLGRFYGDAVALDEGARLSWAYMPHFYMGLYLYTYSAGLAIGYNVAEQIREQGQPAVDRWLDTLRAGTTLPPLELARMVGVDMTSPAPLRRTVAYFGRLVDELEASFS